MKIYENLKNACKYSKLNMLDINPDNFFGKEVPFPIPFNDGDILDYITSLTDGFLESEYKMVLYNGTVAKLDISNMNYMFDYEDIECYFTANTDSYEDLCKLYYTKLNNITGAKDALYLISKDYDANDDLTSYSLSKLVKLK